MSTSAALQAVKALQAKAVKGLPRHIIRFGPLPPPTEPVSAGTLRLPNPFVPRLNPKTGKWRPAAVSLRRQADIVKLAKASNTLHLLPPGPKTPRPTEQTLRAAAETNAKFEGHPTGKVTEGDKNGEDSSWMIPVSWEGKAEYKEVAGAELGTRLYAAKKRMFKGHRWERVKEARDSKKKILLRDMARRVRNYKAVRFRFSPGWHSLTLDHNPVLSKEKAEPSQNLQFCEGTEATLLALSYAIHITYIRYPHIYLASTSYTTSDSPATG